MMIHQFDPVLDQHPFAIRWYAFGAISSAFYPCLRFWAAAV